jgi:adenylate cyclase
MVTAVARSVLGTSRAVLTPDALRLGSTTVPLTGQGELVINWHGDLDQKTYLSYSAAAVLKSFLDMQDGQPPLLSPAVFKDKIVFIGATAASTYDLRVTPLAPFTPGVLANMTALDNILQGRFLRPAPFWMLVVTLLVLCLGTSWSLMLLQSHALGISLILGLGVGYYALAVYAFTAYGLWLELALPGSALAVT